MDPVEILMLNARLKNPSLSVLSTEYPLFNRILTGNYVGQTIRILCSFRRQLTCVFACVEDSVTFLKDLWWYILFLFFNVVDSIMGELVT
jgi:hypothetical protein